MQDKRENISHKKVYLSDNVKIARKVFELTQAQLAEKTGFNRDYIQSVENRGTQPRYEDLYEIANFFRIPIYDFVFKSLSSEDVMKIKVSAKNVYIQSADNSLLQKVNDSSHVYGNISNNAVSHSHTTDVKEIIEENKTLKTRVSFLEGQVQLLKELMGK